MIAFRRIASAAIALSFCVPAPTACGLELTKSPVLVDRAAHVIYDPSTGGVSFFSPNDPLVLMEMQSASSQFLSTDWCASWDLFCISSSRKNAYFDTSGFADAAPLPLGPVLPAQLSYDAIIADVEVDVVRLGEAQVDVSPGGGPYLVFIPEPPSGAIAAAGSLLCLLLQRRRTT